MGAWANKKTQLLYLIATISLIVLVLISLTLFVSFSSTKILVGTAWGASSMIGYVFGSYFSKTRDLIPSGEFSATLAVFIGSLSGTTVYMSGRAVLDPTIAGAGIAACGFALGVWLWGSALPKRKLNSAQLSYRFSLGAAGALIVASAIPVASQLSIGSEHPVLLIGLASVAVLLPSAYLFTLNNKGPFTASTLMGLAAGSLLGTFSAQHTFSLHIWIILISAGALALAPTRSVWQRSLGFCLAAFALVSAPNTNTFRLVGGETGWSESALTIGAVSFARDGANSPDTVEGLYATMESSQELYTSISSNGSSAVFRGSNQELVAILDGFVHQSNSRESDSFRLTPHLAAAITHPPTTGQRALVLGDPLGLATEGLLAQGYTDILVTVPNPAHYRALAELSPAFEATMLHPSVQLLPFSRHETLGSSGDLDLIVEGASTPWHDSFQGIPTAHQLRSRSHKLTDTGVYILSLDLGWLRIEELKTLLENLQGAFMNSWAFLPPNGGDQIILAGWDRDNQAQWDRFVDATTMGESILRGLNIDSPLDLADRAAVKITETILPAVTPERLSALSISRINQRPQMLWPVLGPNFVSPAELFEDELDSALTDLLHDRLESNLAFLQLLETTSRGEMNELFEASRALQSTATGERALAPLVAPYISRARSLIELASQAGPTSEYWGEAQGELAAALLLHPNSVESSILSAEVSLGVGQTNAANSSFNRALQLAPDNAAAALGVARVAMLRRDLPRAERVLRRARDYHPLNWLMAYNLGVITMEKGETALAEELLREAAGLSDDQEATPHTALADLYLSIGEPTRALVEASRAMSLSPTAHNSYIQGKAYYEVEQYEQSERAFQQAVLGDPNLWQARAGLGLIYAVRGDYARCVSAFSDVLTASPNNPMARENLDRCTEAMN